MALCATLACPPLSSLSLAKIEGRSLSAKCVTGEKKRCPQNVTMERNRKGLLKLCTDGRLEESLTLLSRETPVSSSTYSRVLQECINRNSLLEGKMVHAQMVKSGFKTETIPTNHLINMYAKCTCIWEARQVFDKMSERNVVSWTALITGYAQNGQPVDAITVFCLMLEAGMKPNTFTFGSVLSACADMGYLKQGQQVHAPVIKCGLQADVCVGNALCTMFAKCKSIVYARQVFDEMPKRNVISWTAMCSRYLENGDGEEALKLFGLMQLTGVKPNQFTFTTILSACSCVAAMEKGKQVHANIIKNGFEYNVAVANAMLDMYAKCGNIENARKVFDIMPEQELVSWNSIIAGYSQAKRSDKDPRLFSDGDETVKLFGRMRREGMKPDLFTYASVLTACASRASLEQGKQIHLNTIKAGLESDVSVGSALVTMYSKCGSIEGAQKVFDQMAERNVVTWTAMITGYAQHGYGQEALKLFEEMQRVGTKPNHITFIGVLSACSHVGLVNEGICFYNSMINDHDIIPTMDHYACMVDLYGRAGLLNEAVDLINRLPFKPALVWRTLLGACRIHGKMELGKYAAECLLMLEPEDAATYALLSNMYAAVGSWDDVARMRKIIKDKRVVKDPGQSWIEVKNKVHTFVVRDRSHPQAEKIYAKLEKLHLQLKEAGYVPETNFVLHNVEEEEKDYFLSLS